MAQPTYEEYLAHINAQETEEQPQPSRSNGAPLLSLSIPGEKDKGFLGFSFRFAKIQTIGKKNQNDPEILVLIYELLRDCMDGTPDQNAAKLDELNAAQLTGAFGQLADLMSQKKES
jgi:hypothetical protein